MYVQGVSTRKVKAITEELCGHSFSAATISEINKGLDEARGRFAQRRLEEPYAYLILDARYEKVRLDGVIRSQAVLIAIGISWEGRREVLAVELANRESGSSWKDFLAGLRERGLSGSNRPGASRVLADTRMKEGKRHISLNSPNPRKVCSRIGTSGGVSADQRFLRVATSGVRRWKSPSRQRCCPPS
jgi:hypothetical protein